MNYASELIKAKTFERYGIIPIVDQPFTHSDIVARLARLKANIPNKGYEIDFWIKGED